MTSRTLWTALGALMLTLGGAACAHRGGSEGPGADPMAKPAMEAPAPKGAVPEGLSEAEAADWILDKSEAALGTAQLAEVTSRARATRTTLVGQGVSMEGVSYWLGDDKVYMRERFPGLGDIESAYDGETGWSRDPILGMRRLEGAELAQLQQSTLGVEADVKTFFPTRRYLGIVSEGEASYYVVELTPEVGEPIKSYLDMETFYLVRQETVAVSPQGRVPVVATIGDYRLVDGMQVPHRITSVMGPITMEQAVLSVTHNGEVEPGIFAQPSP